jgi:hypothetical protein
MDLQERISSCNYFAAGTCPNQSLLERAYLVPQLMDSSELARCEQLLCPCEQNLSLSAESVSPGMARIRCPIL